MNYTLNRILLLITFFSFWFIGFLNEVKTTYLGVFMVLTVGLIHGANDLKIIEKSGLADNLNNRIKLVIYVLVVLLTFGLFYVFPVPALIFFILFSCFHFGEQHWLEGIIHPSAFLSFFAFIYGVLIISMILVFNISETLVIIKDLIDLDIDSSVIRIIFYFSGASVFILGFFLRKELFQKRDNLLLEFFLLFLLGLIFNTSNLVWSFALYFIIWHAVPSLYSQTRILYGNNRKKGFLQYLKHSLVFWVVSISGLMIAVFLLRDSQAWIISIFFPFIAALTVPHVLIMSKMFEKNN